jgi:hypothetical protein
MMATWINSGWPFLVDQGIWDTARIGMFSPLKINDITYETVGGSASETYTD